MFGQSDRRYRAMLYGHKPDDRRYMEMREARQQYIAYDRQIERLEDKLDNNKFEVYEKREEYEEQLKKSKESRYTLEATFDKRFSVPGYQGLKEEIKRIDFERYGITDRTKGQQGSQDGQEVPVSKKEGIEAVERNSRSMKEAADTKNYELFQTESKEALKHSQEASRKIEYTKQLLHQEMKQGDKDHGNENHGSTLHTEIKKSFSGESGEQHGLTFKEQLEKLNREHNTAIEKKRGHDRDR